MSLFQNKILKKYIAAESGKIVLAYQLFSAFFHNPVIQENIRTSKEEQFQEGFLRELFVKVLGYTLNPAPDYNLITEQKNETNSKKADGAILVNGEVIGIIELKDSKTTDLKTVESQAFGYKNYNRKASYVVTSNFEKLRLYIDNAIDYIEFNLFTLTQEEFSVLWICIAYENISKDLPKQIKAESVSKEDQITKELYKDYSRFKRELFADMVNRNPHYDNLLLFRKSQKLLDRLLFIFFAEDRNLLPPNSMAVIIDQWEKLKELDEYRPLYDRFKKYFGYMNTGYLGKKHEIFAYNGGLFKPDEVLDNITISDHVLRDNSLGLSHYDFESEVDVNILGHIFENSLTEIEEIGNEIATGKKQVSKRKKDGVFYTPRYITSYIVENTLGRLCAEKKEELELDESEYTAEKRRQKATKQRLAAKLKTYREWLLSLTICDPACGSGAFLNAALEFLISEHALLDELTAKLYGDALVFPDIEKAILESNLYGVDINDESVEIAKLSLWLRSAKPNRKLNVLSNNIKCGNSLISDPEVAGDKAFDWQRQFPRIFERGGFDVVIGNPPYVDSETMVKTGLEEQRNYLLKKLKYAKGNWDMYIAFLETGFGLLNNNGIIYFITPDKWLAKSFGNSIREGLLNNFVSLTECGRDVFEDALVDSIIIGARVADTSDIVVRRMTKENLYELGNVSKSDIPSPYNLDWLLSDKIELLKKLQKTKATLIKTTGVVCENACATSDCYALKPFIEDREFDGSKDLKIINTGTIHRYMPLWNVSKMTYLKDKYTSPVVKKESFLSYFKNSYGKKSLKPKLIIKGLTLLDVCLDDTGTIIPGKTTIIISDTENDITKLKAIMAFLNSKLPIIYIKEKYRGATYNQGISFTIDMISDLPCPKTFNAIINDLAKLADIQSNAYHKLFRIRRSFQKRLIDNFDIRVTTALERFDELDFKGFLAELKKQKISLSLRLQDEWEEYFTKKRAACQTLTAQISATDHRIDRMVYDLYGLTEDEIQIIEGN